MIGKIVTFSLLVIILSLVQFSFFKYEFITSSLTVSNGINSLRGQSIEAGLPDPLPRLFFNKIQILIVGTLQWLKHLSPGTLFGNFPKILVIPLVTGLILLIKRWQGVDRWLVILPALITLPAALVYPQIDYQLILLASPFLLLLAVRGFRNFSKQIQLIILIVLAIELVIKI